DNRKGSITLKPFGRILKRNGRSSFRRVKPSHEVGFTPPINMDLEAHGRERRMRWGKRRSSRLRASSSLAGAARFASRSCNLRTKAAVAKVPRAIVGSPRSSRQSVSRLTKRRAAMSLVEMPRLRRASARSRPNLPSAWTAGSGIELVFDMQASVRYCGRKVKKRLVYLTIRQGAWTVGARVLTTLLSQKMANFKSQMADSRRGDA